MANREKPRAVQEIMRWGYSAGIVCAIDRGVHTFNRIKRYLGESVTSKTVSNTLKLLEHEGIIETRYAQCGRRNIPERYLTQKGEEIADVVEAMYEWGNKWIVAKEKPAEVPKKETLVATE